MAPLAGGDGASPLVVGDGPARLHRHRAVRAGAGRARRSAWPPGTDLTAPGKGASIAQRPRPASEPGPGQRRRASWSRASDRPAATARTRWRAARTAHGGFASFSLPGPGCRRAANPVRTLGPGTCPIQVLGGPDGHPGREALPAGRRARGQSWPRSEGTLGLYAMLARPPATCRSGRWCCSAPSSQPGQLGQAGGNRAGRRADHAEQPSRRQCRPTGRPGRRKLINSVSEGGAAATSSASAQDRGPILAGGGGRSPTRSRCPPAPMPQNVIFVDAFHGRPARRPLGCGRNRGRVPGRRTQPSDQDLDAMAGRIPAGPAQRGLLSSRAAAAAWRMPDLQRGLRRPPEHPPVAGPGRCPLRYAP